MADIFPINNPIAAEPTAGLVWDPNTLSWVRAQQASGGSGGSGDVTVIESVLPDGAATAAKQDTGNTSLAAINTSTTKLKLTPASGLVSSSGNNTLITPSSGAKLRISYLSYNPTSEVECAFRFGAAGGLFLRNAAPAGGIIAKDFGDLRYTEGAVNEALILNLSAAVATIWNCFYTEI